MKKTILLFCVLSALVFGCSSAPDEPAAEPAPKPAPMPAWPDWCLNPPPEELGQLYFSGISNPYPTVAEAKTTAKRRAAANVLDFIGTDIESRVEFRIKRRKEGGDIRQTTKDLDSFSTQVSKGVIRNLKTVKWHAQQEAGGGHTVCMLTTISRKDIARSLKEAAEREKAAAEQRKNEILALMTAADKLAGKGSVIPALVNLNKAKELILIYDLDDEAVRISAVEIREQNILADLKLQSTSPTSYRLDTSKKPVRLRFQVVYLRGADEFPISEFPLLVEHSDTRETVFTDADGAGAYDLNLPPGSNRIPVSVTVNRSMLTSRISDTAVSSLALKQVKYQIDVREERLIPENLFADFNLRLWTESEVTVFKKGSPFGIQYSCFTKRCYIKIFAFEKTGPVFLIRDSGQLRLMLNEKRSFRLEGDSPGTISLFAVAATEPFPVAYDKNQSFGREAFQGVIQALRSHKGKKAEFLLNVRITD